MREAVAFFASGDPFLKLEYSAAGVPVLAKGDVKPFGRVEHGEKRYVSASLVSARNYRTTHRGDYLLTTRDLTQEADFLGLLAPIPQDQPYLVNQGANVVRFHPGIDGRYLVYWCNGPVYRAYIKGHHVGSTQIHIRKEDFLGAPLWVPSQSEQRAIAHILGTLDDKIELNRRMNETLEAMARALFKSWFVDFDPVRAKAERRDPGLPQALADLFPDSFEDSELGEIPRGWGAAPLPDVIDVNPTRQLKKGEVAPYLDMANMPSRGHTPDDVIERPFGSGMRFKNGDTLVARITPCLENGKTAYVDFLHDEEVGWGSTEYIVLRPKPPLPSEFAYCLARSNEFREFAIQSMTGSSGRQRVPAESLSHYLVATPRKEIAARFGQTVGPLFERASCAAHESRALAALRDALLPKLISGELRVKDAAIFIGSVH
jgi:type I restriction enzyme, S subunit